MPRPRRGVHTGSAGAASSRWRSLVEQDRASFLLWIFFFIPCIELSGEGYHLPVKKIIVGPSRESVHHYKALQTILKEKGTDPEIVIPSNIPYRGK
jgi:hypothetical protein